MKTCFFETVAVVTGLHSVIIGMNLVLISNAMSNGSELWK